LRHTYGRQSINRALTSKLQFSPNFTLNSVADSNYRGKCEVGGFLIFEWTLEECIFQQDNARPHIARSSLVVLEEEQTELLPWPRFPDLSPIEKVWDAMGKFIDDLPHPPTTLEELRGVVARHATSQTTPLPACLAECRTVFGSAVAQLIIDFF
jgi:hypothetical protein